MFKPLDSRFRGNDDSPFNHIFPRLLLWILFSVLVVVLDQVTKYLITQKLQFGDTLALTSFFNLVLAHNTGAAFSLLANAGGWQRWFFTGTAVIASVVIVILLRKYARETLFSLALSLVLGGALGNLLDRIRFGYVVDFLYFNYQGWDFPAFNVADAAIFCGAVLLIWESFKKPATAGPKP